MGSGLALDARAAVRALLASRAGSIAAALTLALAVGATTALFSVANGLILRPLPVKDPQRLVTISSDTPLRFGFQAGGGWNYEMWERLRARAGAFDGGFAWMLQTLELSDAALGGRARFQLGALGGYGIVGLDLEVGAQRLDGGL